MEPPSMGYSTDISSYDTSSSMLSNSTATTLMDNYEADSGILTSSNYNNNNSYSFYNNNSNSHNNNSNSISPGNNDGYGQLPGKMRMELLGQPKQVSSNRAVRRKTHNYTSFFPSRPSHNYGYSHNNNSSSGGSYSSYSNCYDNNHHGRNEHSSSSSTLSPSSSSSTTQDTSKEKYANITYEDYLAALQELGLAPPLSHAPPKSECSFFFFFFIGLF